MAIGGNGISSGAVSPTEHRARRWRLLIIIGVAAALAAGTIYIAQRKKSDEAAADAAAASVATQLQPQLANVNLQEAFPAYAAWAVNHSTPLLFPTMPKVEAALLDYSATPNSVAITYQVTTRGLDRCVTGTFSPDAGPATSINDCVHR
jgi:hypothetical protein